MIKWRIRKMKISLMIKYCCNMMWLKWNLILKKIIQSKRSPKKKKQSLPQKSQLWFMSKNLRKLQAQLQSSSLQTELSPFKSYYNIRYQNCYFFNNLWNSSTKERISKMKMKGWIKNRIQRWSASKWNLR